MKQIALLGDSIRLGYQATVAKELGGIARVWGPEGNCMHSIHHLLNLGWYLEQPWDIIHFNFGLWDCRRLSRVRPENLVPVDLFVRNLDFLLETLRKKTSAKLIWATITPVIQSRYDARFATAFEPCREATDCTRYDQAAAPVLARHGIEINDLHAHVIGQGAETMIGEDGIHYTPEGSVNLGLRVAQILRRSL